MMEIEWNGIELEDKEWHKHLANMLELGELNPDIVPYLNSYQHYAINEIKKYYARKEYAERRIGDNPDENNSNQG